MFDLGMVAIGLHVSGPQPVFTYTVSNDELTLIPLDNPKKHNKLRRVRMDASGNDQYTYINRGSNNLSRNPQQAVKDYGKAIELDPKFAEPYISRGLAYGLLGNHKEAIKNYNKAIELDPKSESAYYSRGMAYSSLGNHHEAIKDCNKAIELNPKFSAAYAIRGYAYGLLGNYQQGIKDIEHSIDLWPDFALSYYDMACIYSLQNNADTACQWLKKAIEKGYKDWKHLKGDKDFDNIRNTSCFQEIIKSQ